MTVPQTTSWKLIHQAARGDRSSRDEFAERYLMLLRDYLGARWRGHPLFEARSDAVQEIFVECFRDGGVLDKADPSRRGGFRALLYGVARNVALRYEKRVAQQRARQASSTFELDEVVADGDTLSRQFDRAWARHLLRLAVQAMAAKAETKDEQAPRRVEILRLRYQDGHSIRDIARLWDVDPVALHRQFTRAKREFKTVLMQILRDEWPEAREDPERHVAVLLQLLR